MIVWERNRVGWEGLRFEAGRSQDRNLFTPVGGTHE